MDRKSRRGKEAQLWFEIQDLIGKASMWPPSIRKLFWQKDLNYFDRFKFVTFCFVNGLYPQLAIKWLNLHHGLRDQDAKRHVLSLFENMENGVFDDAERYRYYAYNVSTMRQEFINGTRKVHRQH